MASRTRVFQKMPRDQAFAERNDDHGEGALYCRHGGEQIPAELFQLARLP